jgi:hypothetical protein
MRGKKVVCSSSVKWGSSLLGCGKLLSGRDQHWLDDSDSDSRKSDETGTGVRSSILQPQRKIFSGV